MINTNQTHPWLVVNSPAPTARIRVICFPHAGGGSVPFHGWSRDLGQEFEVCSVLLPGRERRHREPVIERFDVLLDRIYEAVCTRLDRPLALFGYSMGALLALEVARRLRRDGLPLPVHLFVAARRAPHLPSWELPIHECSDETLLDETSRVYGEIAGVVRNDPELRSLFTRALRADYRVVASYNFRVEPPLACPVTALGGELDSMVDRAGLEAWSGYSGLRFSLYQFSGGHFFLHSHRSALLSTVRRELSGALEVGANG